MIEYIKNLATVMIMVSIANILLPEGSIKKFAALSMGFIIISVAIYPIGDLFSDEISMETFTEDTEHIAAAEKTQRETVLLVHKENLERKIKEHIKHGSDVSVSVDDNANITDVSITLRGDESSAVAYIVNTLKLPRERIKLIYENN